MQTSGSAAPMSLAWGNGAAKETGGENDIETPVDLLTRKHGSSGDGFAAGFAGWELAAVHLIC